MFKGIQKALEALVAIGRERNVILAALEMNTRTIAEELKKLSDEPIVGITVKPDEPTPQT